MYVTIRDGIPEADKKVYKQRHSVLVKETDNVSVGTRILESRIRTLKRTHI